ncbi:acetylserotonin O-methyltransferase [Tsukamurella sp. PLM1]|uniref:acetylserotonin O-methyltransferase n=1 Tax=Tsukamurella sp. PLM1 TaxID=2929795 RepID=UPI00204C00E2|nr:acetylserotonin O-methyltransferase [Tsukamurella sp. PLM1]BDH57827.1 hydroxyneurosporene-O-methyltransferase [Tsukamurella sp. PLM1]
MNLSALAVRTGAAAGRLLHTIADAPVPPEMRVFTLLNRAYETEVVIALVRLGVPDALADGPRTAPDIAASVDADPDALLRLLRVAESLHLVRRAGTAYRLAPMGRALRDSAAAAPAAPYARYAHNPATRAAWSRLAEAVRAGRSQFEAANGSTTWQWFTDHPESEREFTAAMRALCDYNGPELAALYPWPEGATICDVGGGIGTLISHVLATDPSLRGVVVDQAGPIGEAPEFLAGRGVRDRVLLEVRDFFAPLDVRADVYVLKDILHDWDDERAIAILRSVRDAMRVDDRLVLVEFLQNPDRAHPLVPMVDLTMLTQTDGGRQRSPAEFDRLFAAADLHRTALYEGALHSLIEATPG